MSDWHSSKLSDVERDQRDNDLKTALYVLILIPRIIVEATLFPVICLAYLYRWARHYVYSLPFPFMYVEKQYRSEGRMIAWPTGVAMMFGVVWWILFLIDLIATLSGGN